MDDWQQVTVEFTDRHSAEQVAVEHLLGHLTEAQATGAIAGWWFVRKTPYWRLRYRPADHGAQRHLTSMLTSLVDEERAIGWTTDIYEPETVAFGGTAAMTVAHELFSHDSRNVLHYLTRSASAASLLGRREVGVMLCSTLFRGAGLDWYEQGDVWATVAQHRTDRTTFSVERLTRLKTALHRLMTVDTSPSSPLIDGGPLADLTDWLQAFEQAGRHLAGLARRGTLERGLRAVLAHHVIFHWNRLGLSYTEQSTVAELAKEVVMAEEHSAAFTPGRGSARTRVGEVKTETTETTDNAADAERLRAALAERLRDQGTVHTERVEAALRAVPRHVFVPGVPLEAAYADEPIYTKHDGGVSLSAASQPTIVAMMLEQLQVHPGQRILELGAGTGYNAALLAHLTGPDGRVTTIDVDDDLTTGAQAALAAADVRNVRVVLGDGALGDAADAPYERIIATVGAWAGNIPEAWLRQLTPDGRLVVPLRLRGSVSRSIAFERDGDRWVSRGSEMCTFMPLRGGVNDDPRHLLDLTGDGAVILQTNQEQAVNTAALEGVLAHPSSEVWTGVLFGGSESFEWLDLWLTCTTGGLSRMTVERSAVTSGLVRPQFGWGGPAVTAEGALAYLTLRPTEADGQRRYEVGVIGHGPGGDELADQVATEIRTWDQTYRSRTAQFEIRPPGADPIEPGPGRFTVEGPSDHRFVISWI